MPNALSIFRLACAPGMVGVAVAGERGWFLILLTAALLSDALDGYIARRWRLQSELGRRLDSWGDYTTFAALAVGLGLLWPGLVRAEWPWFCAGVAGYGAIIVYGLARYRKILSYHTWFSKSLAVLLPVALAVMLVGWAEWPFRFACALQVLAGLEELGIAFALPGHSGEVPSLWHARRSSSRR